MNTYCGAHCASCPYAATCLGCVATCGSPFGGTCVAAEYIKLGGREAYGQFKEKLLGEVNALLAAEGIGKAEKLYELTGQYVNLAYPMPSGERVKLLKDENIYLGAQVELPGQEQCCGVVADTTFILLARYGENGSDPELLCYHRR